MKSTREKKQKKKKKRYYDQAMGNTRAKKVENNKQKYIAKQKWMTNSHGLFPSELRMH